jgi:hypothetical protein
MTPRMTGFTHGQGDRMRKAWGAYRAVWPVPERGGGINPPVPPPPFLSRS